MVSRRSINTIPPIRSAPAKVHRPRHLPTVTSLSDSSQTSVSEQKWVATFREQILADIPQQMSDVLGSLPPEYFDSLPEEDRVTHLKALMAFQICDVKQEIMLRQADDRTVTVLSGENYPGFLANLIRRLPDDRPLIGAKIFTSSDQQFIIDMFQYQVDEPEEVSADTIGGSRDELVEQVVSLSQSDADEVRRFVAMYHPENEILRSPEELTQQFRAIQATEHVNDIAVVWEQVGGSLKKGTGTLDENLKQNAVEQPTRASPLFQQVANGSSEREHAKVVVSAGSMTTRAVFQRAADFFAEHGVDIERAYCENLRADEEKQLAVASFHVSIDRDQLSKLHQRFGSEFSPEFDGDVLRSRLATYMRLDEEVVSVQLAKEQTGSVYFGDPRTAELFYALARLTYHLLEFQGANLSRERVVRSLAKRRATAVDLLTRFQNRFDHGSNGETELASVVDFGAMSDSIDRRILRAFCKVADSVQRTNLFLRGRRSLAFRLDGALFENPARGETPFAVFYVYGQGFDAFHVRFRDVARGGMRFVPTRSKEQYLFESSRLFDEVYRLSSAQQLKNKDIAEGGAKAVILMKPSVNTERAGRDFVDGLLDLTTATAETSSRDAEVVDAEFLYLGPDENVTNSFINWVVTRARERGYPLPETLMSSKPGSGINHKEFGVTSEGVIVFLHRALLEHGFEPQGKPFTIKMTGGPDGDVGGNGIKILIREYGENVRIVAIADGTGAAHDPEGLDHTELERLVENGLGIEHFDSSKLSSNARLTTLANDEEVAFRNNLHFTVNADVFLPAGGRPSTINAANWQGFIDADGSPVSQMIVEGANLFVTPEARAELSKCGVAIVKDSSANKCGVICSSMEILAGMLISEEQFAEIRSDYIAEVLEILRSLARIEAISLFNEHRRQPQRTLPEISVLISEQIIRVADVVTESFDRWSDADHSLAAELVEAFMPQSLVGAVGGNLFDSIPLAYRKQFVAAILSSRLVYREGIANLSQVTVETLEQIVRHQLGYEAKTRELLSQLGSSSLPDRDLLMAIIDQSGTRSQQELRL